MRSYLSINHFISWTRLC